MRLIKIRVGEQNMTKMATFWKWYEKVFFIVWIGLGLLITIYHSMRLF
jgi:hypothetical protein